MKPELAARAAALDILTAVVLNDKTTDRAFADCQPWAALPAADKSFVRALVMTVLRHFGQINQILSAKLSRPLPKKQMRIQLILMLGVAQLLFLKTPAYAAINTSVELVRVIKQSSFTKLVNAVLRGVAKQTDMPPVHANIPDWLYGAWVAAYGQTKTNALITALQGEPPLDITVKENPERWALELGGTVLPVTGTVRLTDYSDVTALSGFKTGDWWVQEAAAAIPAQLFTDVSGKRVADLCAAPGGKTAQLAARGAHVTAFDISAHRLKRLTANMERLGFSDRVTVQTADALTLSGEKAFDAVLLDAPCSATGTILRHPEILIQRAAADSERLAALQQKLLRRAIELVKPGGEIVYSTCSLQPIENEGVVSAVLADCPFVERVPLPEKWHAYLNEAGAVQMIPGQFEMDGFYAVLLRKR